MTAIKLETDIDIPENKFGLPKNVTFMETDATTEEMIKSANEAVKRYREQGD